MKCLKYYTMQSKIDSLIEACTNVFIGYVVAIVAQCLIFPLFGIYVPFTDQLLIGLLFTGVSIARSYAVRRVFNNKPIIQRIKTWKWFHWTTYGITNTE